METAEEREVSFKKDLAELLKKHGAELDIGDDGKAYGMQSGRCEISMMSVYNENDEL